GAWERPLGPLAAGLVLPQPAYSSIWDFRPMEHVGAVVVLWCAGRAQGPGDVPILADPAVTATHRAAVHSADGRTRLPARGFRPSASRPAGVLDPAEADHRER